MTGRASTLNSTSEHIQILIVDFIMKSLRFYNEIDFIMKSAGKSGKHMWLRVSLGHNGCGK